MNPRNFFDDVAVPTIEGLQLHKSDLDLCAGVQQTFGAIIHESGGLIFRRQVGGGPARGLGQIEGASLRDFMDNWLRFRPEFRDRIEAVAAPVSGLDWFDQLETNDHLTVALTRMLFFRVPAPLPSADDLIGHARYWKRHYNTVLGKGTVEKYVRDIRQHAPWLYPDDAWEVAAASIANGATAA